MCRQPSLQTTRSSSGSGVVISVESFKKMNIEPHDAQFHVCNLQMVIFFGVEYCSVPIPRYPKFGGTLQVVRHVQTFAGRTIIRLQNLNM